MAAIEKKYLQATDNTIKNSITKHVREVIQHLFDNYVQVRQTTLNEHEHGVKTIFYTLTEPLSTVFTQIEDIGMLAKAAKNPYLEIQLVKIAMNIIKSTNDFEKVQADWYVKYQ